MGLTKSYCDAPEFAEVRRLLAEHFKDNQLKVNVWLTTPNPALGNVAPCTYLELGRGEKLLKWVKYQLAENKP